MSGDEMERFEITDYDLENEFNINRPRRRLTKNQQIYGIWADEEGGDDQRPGFSGGSGRKNYTAPVSFISAGVQQAGKKEKAQEADNMDANEEKSDDDIDNSSSSDEASSRPSRTPGFGMSHHRKKKSVPDDVIAGLRRRTGPSYVGKGLGDWERHTKGIGAKLLLQMGYQPGRGLGKELQGISAPIVAQKRKGRGALGAYGPEVGAKPAPREVSDEEEEKEYKEKLSQWRKGDGGKKTKVKYVFKSVEEVLEEGKTRKLLRKEDSHLTKVKVIDMTGPERRIFSGYQALSGHQRPSDEWDPRKEKKFANFALPELLHNLDLVVEMCEQDILRNDRKMRSAQDRIIVLNQEEGRLDELLDQEEQQIEGFNAILEVVDRLLGSAGTTLEEASEAFQKLQTRYPKEYRSYDLSSLGVGLVAPLIKEEISSWKPLENPGQPVEIFRKWRDILRFDDNSNRVNDPYQQLIWEAWMPLIRIAVSSWECRSCEPMIAFLERWVPLVPAWILDHICEQLILPKIQLEVENWNPLTDMVPIHAWIHPWLPLLGSRLESVYPTIRQKLGTALGAWHPSDRSAKMILQPWVSVFSRGATEAFLLKNVMPKLQLAMQEFVINPHQQHLDQWQWVMEWESLLPPSSMASLLEKHFFPKWLGALAQWLSSPGGNYEEVGKWYRGWKRMLSESLQAQPSVKSGFSRALEIMDRAASGQMPIQPVLQNAATQDGNSPSRIYEQFPSDMARVVPSQALPPHGYKELLERRCEERGILFVPVPNRWQEGKPVYRCGRMLVYVDRNVVFAFREGRWSPIELQKLLDDAAG